MFRKTQDKIESLERQLKWQDERMSDLKSRYYDLDRKIDRLAAYLGVVEVVTNKIEYTKKGGPERP
jgi:hypothetical protein